MAFAGIFILLWSRKIIGSRVRSAAGAAFEPEHEADSRFDTEVLRVKHFLFPAYNGERKQETEACYGKKNFS